MRKTFLAALMATIAAFPIAANAQDGRGDRQQRRQFDNGGGQAQPRPDRAQRQQADPAQQASREARRAQFQADPAQQAARDARRAQFQQGGGQQRFDRSGDRQAGQPVQQQQQDRGNRGGWNGRVEQPQAAQPLPQQNRIDRRGGNDGFRDNGGRLDRSPNVAPQQNRGWNNDRDRTNRNWNGNRRWNDNRGWNGNNDRRYDRGNNWNRNWRQDNRYNWQSYRNSNRNAYRLPRYYAPYGWNRGYQRFSIGGYLSAGLFARNYWIDDPYSYRLPDVDWPYQWVRYYNDALLIDTESGEVVDVISDIFW